MRIVLLLGLLGAVGCARSTAPVSSPPVGPTAASVLLITIDTLRADRLGCYGDGEARTPALDALARRGTVYLKAYAPTPVTLPSHATLMTGLLPPAHGVRGNGTFALGAGPRTLAEALRARGMRTAAFISGFPLVRRFGLARGFDHYDDALGRAPGVHFDFAERDAASVTRAAMQWLSANPGPAFVWVHLFDPHAPYAPPAAHRMADPYRGEVAAVDAALAPLLALWEARSEPALTVVTADHGEAFGEHGEESHSLFVYDTTLHVPLIVRGPGVPEGARRSEAVGLADVGATLAGRAGAGGALPGRDLLSTAAPASAGLYAETLAPRLDFGWSELRAWREGGLKYIRAPRPELYDLAADPAESTNLAATRSADLARMERALAAALLAAGETESRRAADPETTERLRALGYVQGPGGKGSGADPKDKVLVARRIAQAVGPFPDHAAAARAYTELAQLDPANPLVQMRLADALLRAGRAKDAVPAFRRVVAAGPRSADPFVGLATALARLERLDEAHAVLTEALAVAPDDGQVHFNLGEIARTRGDRAEATRQFRLALQDPVTRARAEARLAGLP